MFGQSAVISLNMETVSLHVSSTPVFLPFRVSPGDRACCTRGDLCNAFPGPDGGVEGVGSGQSNLPQQVWANCLREPRRRQRCVPALPERKQISSFCGGGVEGPALKHNRNRKKAARQSQQTADDKRFLQREDCSLPPQRGSRAAPAGCASRLA